MLSVMPSGWIYIYTSVVHSQYGYRASWIVPSVNLVHRWLLREGKLECME